MTSSAASVVAGTRSRRRIAFIALLGILSAAVPVKRADAHPHAWIDVTVQVLFNDAGEVTGLRETWLFDEYYTAFAMEGLGRSGARPSQSDIDALLRENMNRLADYSYFTRVESDGATVAFASVTPMSSTLRGARLEMSFVLPFKEPVDMAGANFEYAIYDPTYYIEMLHAESSDAIRLAGAPTDCEHRLIEPTPTMEAVMLAQALDRTETASDGLGATFAERVKVRCP